MIVLLQIAFKMDKYSFLKKWNLLFIYGDKSAAHGGQKKELDLLELELPGGYNTLQSKNRVHLSSS